MTNDLAILTDEPSRTGKALDFSRYSGVLAQIIKGSPPNFSIGIFGGWGTGKTTLMKLIMDELKDDQNILTVWFNAWKFEKEQYLAVIPLLRTIRLALDEYSQKTPALSPSKLEILKRGIEFSSKAFLKATTLSVGIKDVVSTEVDLSKIVESFKVGELFEGDANTIYYHSMDYLQKALEKFLKSENKFRIVVFIDDVDRCTPEKGFEVLESIKSFFDMKGIVFVMGMNSETIDFLVGQKFGQDSKIKGMDYLKKIVQLPFQVPKWTDRDISSYVDSILAEELEGSEFQRGFSPRAKKLLISAVERNPREVKRFINHIILAQSVFKKDVEPLLAVNALRFNREWEAFLDFISRDDRRKAFFNDYNMLSKNEKALDDWKKQLSFYYQNIIELGHPLREFLDYGGAEILASINIMEEYRRALDTTTVGKSALSILPGWTLTPSSVSEPGGISIQYSKEEIPKKRPEGRQWYQVTVWIDAPTVMMKEISKVTYRFHPTFRPQFDGKDYVSIASQDQGFKFAFKAYGSFALAADIELTDGKTERISRFLEITYTSPKATYLKAD